MENKTNYQLTPRNFIPLMGWSEYRKRTGAPVNDSNPKANRQEQLLAFYNIGLSIGAILVLKEGLEAILK